MFSEVKPWLHAAALTISLLAASTGWAANEIRLATTTSTDNSGLLDFLLPRFEARYAAKVHVIAVGTGKALKLGENGDVDVVLVHSRPDEDGFVAAGHGVNRRDVMYNDFVIVGPAADPAGIRNAREAPAAFRRIYATRAGFISRGDDSGTHKKEMALWKELAISPQTNPGYKAAGRGMGEVLLMASELGAYTLTDRATQRALADKTGLEILLQRDPGLFNPYGIIAVNPARHPGVNYTGAMELIKWITSPEGQQAIAQFKVDGEQLFFPSAK